jgi:hypothetical protein
MIMEYHIHLTVCDHLCSFCKHDVKQLLAIEVTGNGVNNTWFPILVSMCSLIKYSEKLNIAYCYTLGPVYIMHRLHNKLVDQKHPCVPWYTEAVSSSTNNNIGSIFHFWCTVFIKWCRSKCIRPGFRSQCTHMHHSTYLNWAT